MGSNKGMRWLLLISGILVLLLGIFMLFSPFENLVAVSIYISISMLITGIAEIVTFFTTDKQARSGWLLANGIISTLFGIWAVFGSGQAALFVALPYIFATWVLTSSILRITASFSLKDFGFRNWGWVLFLGIIGTILGFLLLFSPLYSAFVATYTLAFMFMAYGINSIVLFFSLPKNK